ARSRRRLGGLRARPAGRGARQGRRGPHGFDRARRDPRALRSHPRHVPGAHRQGVRYRRNGRGNRPGNGGGGTIMTDTTKTGVAEELLKRAVAPRFDVREVIVVPAFAVLIALAIGGLVMLATGVSLTAIGASYLALFEGSVGSVYALSETLSAAVPLTLCALGLAVGFKAGLFNIGAGGQIILGGAASVAGGFSSRGLSTHLHLPRSCVAG